MPRRSLGLMSGSFLLEHVRNGIARMDAGEIDPLELDDLIDHYKRGKGIDEARALTTKASSGEVAANCKTVGLWAPLS